LPVLAACVGLVMTIVVMATMGIQAVRGELTVNVQRDRLTVHEAALDNAFYHCIEVQVRSLVGPGQPVELEGNVGDVINLLKAVGSWVTVAHSYAAALGVLTLTDNVHGPETCRGNVAQIRYLHPRNGVVVRTGTGSSVPGTGPPPAPPL